MAEESLSEFSGVVRQSLGEYFYRKASLRGELLHLWLRCSGPAPVLSVVRQSKGQLGECSFHEVELTLSNVVKHRDEDLGFECSLRDFGTYFASAIRDNISVRESTGEFLGLELNYSDLELVGVLQLATLMPYVSESILRLLLFQHEVLQRKDQPVGDDNGSELRDDAVRLPESALTAGGGAGGSGTTTHAKKRARAAGGNIFNPGAAKMKGKGAKINK